MKVLKWQNVRLVALDAGLSDPSDARDITEVIFRVMRDLMTTDAADHVASDLHEPVLQTQDKTDHSGSE